MLGLMMDYPLTLQQFLDRNRRLFSQKEVVTRTAQGPRRYTYADFQDRVARLANALTDLGVQQGDRIATIAWNTNRHLEFYFAVPCMGAVLHTINMRLSPEQIVFIINDAADRILAVDRELLPIVEPLLPRLASVEHVIVLQDDPAEGSSYLDYETLLAAAAPTISWPQLDENTAAGICYTSGTTGNSKGVVYSHRSIYLHTMALAGADVMALSESDVVLPVVPMFHANTWGLAHAAVAVGSELVLAGVAPTPGDILDLIESEGVTLTAGVPTIWLGCLTEQRAHPRDVSSLRAMPCGGSAPPRSLIEAIEREWGVPVLQAWGMTETSPVATMYHLKTNLSRISDEERHHLMAKQGLPILGMDVTIMDEDGVEVPWNGQDIGEIVVRGPWVTSGYLHLDMPDRFTDGWFRTGDVACIDPEGYVQIVDRTKDLVKSGGEWISSVDLENLIMGHPDVAEASVIAVPHPKWVERPLAVVVPRTGTELTSEAIIEFVRPHVAPYAVPDAVVFVDEIPKTGTGKFDKKVLRQRFAESR